jgi:hypothetical protein
MYLKRICIFFLCAVFAQPLFAEDILTTTPVTYMLSSQLMKGTPITTAYLAPKRYGIERLPNWYASKGENIVATAGKQATVAITLKALWADDPLFVYARQGNIKLIEIDASQSISPRASSIATVTLSHNTPSLYAWLNPNNLTAMLSIVAQDLMRVWPEYKQQITQNLQSLQMATRQLINQQQQVLFDKEIDSVVLLSDQLEDFASANQLFVVHRLVKDELEWTTEDQQALQSLLTESPHLWFLTTKKVSKKLSQLFPDFTHILVVDSLDRWGRKGIDSEQPLQRWLFK